MKLRRLLGTAAAVAAAASAIGMVPAHALRVDAIVAGADVPVGQRMCHHDVGPAQVVRERTGMLSNPGPAVWAFDEFSAHLNENVHTLAC